MLPAPIQQARWRRANGDGGGVACACIVPTASASRGAWPDVLAVRVNPCLLSPDCTATVPVPNLCNNCQVEYILRAPLRDRIFYMYPDQLLDPSPSPRSHGARVERCVHPHPLALPVIAGVPGHRAMPSDGSTYS